MLFNYILALILAILIAIFAIYNVTLVRIDFIFWKGEISTALVVLVSALLGAVAAGLIGLIDHLKMGWKLYRAEGRSRELEHVIRDYQERIAELEGKVSVEE